MNTITHVLRTSIALAKIEFKLRNEDSYLGVLWYLLDPILMFLILISIRKLFNADVENYPLYLLLGLVMFNFFRKTTSSVAKTISSPQNQRISKALIIDQNVFILSAFIQALYIHFFEWLVLLTFLIYFKISLLNIFLYPLIFVLLGIFTLGISFILATIAIYVKDILNVWAIVTRLLWFATPIFYSSKITLPFNFDRVNPLAHILTIARNTIVYQRPSDPLSILYVFGLGLFTLVFGMYWFKQHKHIIAERT